MNSDLQRKVDAILEELRGSLLDEIFAEVESYPLPCFCRVEVGSTTTTTMVMVAQSSNEFESTSVPLPPLSQVPVVCQGKVAMETSVPIRLLAVTGRSEELPWAA